jgi:transglutaminase-like putative cysteine protease
LRVPRYPDPENRLALWTKNFVLDAASTDTLALLGDLNTGIKSQFRYQVRDEYGTQTPLETLHRGWGTCRDLAMLLIEAVRGLGLGARIVTGYLYSPNSADAGSIAMEGASGTHAWAEIYLPGAGWIAYDPTHGTVGSTDLIRIAVARDISQVIPIAGSYTGVPDDYLGMTVTVCVTSAEIFGSQRQQR